MCTRYVLHASPAAIAAQFALEEIPEILPRYNIAPSTLIPAIVASNHCRAIQFYQWGLVPSWAKDPSIATKLVMARGETVFEKPSFRGAAKYRRCLIPADGFFEWRTIGKQKQPFYIHLRQQELMAMGGLYEIWERPEGVIASAAVITTESNALISQIHERMPVIIGPEDYDTWLDPYFQDHEAVGKLIRPYAADRMEMYPVTRLMGNPRFDNPEAIRPIEATTLFD